MGAEGGSDHIQTKTDQSVVSVRNIFTTSLQGKPSSCEDAWALVICLAQVSLGVRGNRDVLPIERFGQRGDGLDLAVRA